MKENGTIPVISIITWKVEYPLRFVSVMFNPLYSSTDQQLFEKLFYSQTNN